MDLVYFIITLQPQSLEEYKMSKAMDMSQFAFGVDYPPSRCDTNRPVSYNGNLACERVLCFAFLSNQFCGGAFTDNNVEHRSF
jgi:hypothetical protein